MLVVALWSLVACTGKVEDSAEPADTDYDPPPQGTTCEELWIKVNGEEPPVVGDTWTVWLYCDDALLTGTFILGVDPPTAATIEQDTTNLTWVEAGPATVNLQVGSRRGSLDVEVGATRK